MFWPLPELAPDAVVAIGSRSVRGWTSELGFSTAGRFVAKFPVGRPPWNNAENRVISLLPTTNADQPMPGGQVRPDAALALICCVDLLGRSTGAASPLWQQLLFFALAPPIMALLIHGLSRGWANVV